MSTVKATVGGKVTASITNQALDIPNLVATASDATQRAITSATFANIPTASVTASLVLTRTTLVMIVVSSQIGSGALAAPNNSAYVGVALSGALSEAASDINAIAGTAPGLTVGAPLVLLRVAPAGTLTATIQARYLTSSGINIRNNQVQIAALAAA